MNWYEDPAELAGALSFVLRYSCLFDWAAFISDSTPCYKYREHDKEIFEGLKIALKKHLCSLTKAERRELNREISALLGERHFVKEAAIIKLISRLFADGDPRKSKGMMAFALEMQRIELLAALKAS